MIADFFAFLFETSGDWLLEPLCYFVGGCWKPFVETDGKTMPYENCITAGFLTIATVITLAFVLWRIL